MGSHVVNICLEVGAGSICGVLTAGTFKCADEIARKLTTAGAAFLFNRDLAFGVGSIAGTVSSTVTSLFFCGLYLFGTYQDNSLAVNRENNPLLLQRGIGLCLGTLGNALFDGLTKETAIAFAITILTGVILIKRKIIFDYRNVSNI